MGGIPVSAFLCLVMTTFCHACNNVEIVSRASWGAQVPTSSMGLLPFPTRHVFIAHTVTPQCHDFNSCSRRMQSMQNYHMDKLGWFDIAYNFIIGGDGRVYEAGGWRKVSIHTKGWNAKSLGIAFIGDFSNIRPNENMLRSARALIICGIQQGFISENREVHGARDGTCTNSPGNALYDIIKTWPGFKGGRLPGYTC